MYFTTLTEMQSFIENEHFDTESTLMLMVADQNADDISAVTSYLNQKGLTFFGGIYSGLLVGNKNLRTGFIMEMVKPAFCSMALPFIMPMKTEQKSLAGKTAIVLVDGLSSKMKDLINTIYRKVGSEVNYIGGGAGFYSMEHKPCIFDNNGIYKDVAYVCIIDDKATVNIKHGWRKLNGSFTITRSNDNVLSRIDGDNAYEVYRSIIEDEERLTILKEDFFAYARDYPFGISQKDGSIIVRDPISVNDEGEIICVADVPEESEIYVLNGNVDTLLESSKEIAQHCIKSIEGEYKPLLFNCISRAMFMEDIFEQELSNIQNQLSCTVEGALSIGELASSSDGEIIIHNKSTVLALLQE